MKKTNIGLIGAGNIGHALAKRLVELGYMVQVANSKGPHSLAEFARRTGATPVSVNEVITHVDILFIAIPLGNVRQLREPINSIAEHIIVVDTGNYIPQRDGAIRDIDHGLPETTWVSRQLGVPVVKAFNNIIASRIATASRPMHARDRIALPVAADDSKSRKTIMELVEELGFAAYDAGPLVNSWRQQPGQPAYCTDPISSELPSLLERADQQKGPANRDKAMKVMAKIPSSFPAQDLVRVSRLSIGLDTLKPGSWFAMLRFGFAMIRSLLT